MQNSDDKAKPTVYDRRPGKPSSDAEKPLKLSIIIVTWNCFDLIAACLDHITQSGADFSYEIIVVDNNSHDKTLELVLSRRDVDVVINSNQNLGFGAGNNLGSTLATGDLILFLNPDAYLLDNRALSNMVELLRLRPKTAALGPQLLNLDGSHQVGDAGHAPNLSTIMNYMFFFSIFSPRMNGYYINSNSILSGPVTPVGWIAGTCLMIRTDAFRAVAGFNERIFMYGEDVELCDRLAEAGYIIEYAPHIRVTHLQGATQKTAGQLYISTKWIEALYKSSAIERGGAASARVLTAIFAIGFAARIVAYFLLSFLGRTSERNEKVRSMIYYLSYVVRGRDKSNP